MGASVAAVMTDPWQTKHAAMWIWANPRLPKRVAALVVTLPWIWIWIWIWVDPRLPEDVAALVVTLSWIWTWT